MPGMTILGTGSYKPSAVITNAMLEGIVETSDEWIVSRTGISQRSVAAAGENSLSMSLAAARAAIDQSGVDPKDIGVLVVATLTGDFVTPSLSCLLQRDLGLEQNIIPMDINCACSGFVFALKTAHALLEGSDKVALVIGCEMLTRITDYTDRATCILFGDGAGAAVVRRDADGLFSFDGGGRGDDQVLVCKAQYLANTPFADREKDRTPGGVFMNGSEVFRFALETAPVSVKAALDQAGLKLEEVDHFVFHQANGRIIEGVTRRLGLDPDKCIVNIGDTGNTSSASVAIALDQLNRSGRLKRGQTLVISAFGGGLTYATVCLKW